MNPQQTTFHGPPEAPSPLPNRIHLEERIGAATLRIRTDGAGVYRVELEGEIHSPGRGSLAALGIGGMVPVVDGLPPAFILAALVSAQLAPFPLGGGGEVFDATLAAIRDKGMGAFFEDGKVPPLSSLYLQAVMRGARGWNAPVDSYLMIARDTYNGIPANRRHSY